ncbi:hypothetical protein [Siminovitchia fordii]|uniref:Uncharacterized protein n=1 Tax=Siminovitchia fordii TaxID=254759 RepID=A0ABQ4K364_9BACI|nr:hypothetical protein [Siminovitchia fordii]GIN19318.1 hypothetical protein J1TS3_04520 [Siminovitchia fordii]
MRFLISYILTLFFFFLLNVLAIFIGSQVNDYSFNEYFNFFLVIYIPIIVLLAFVGVVIGEFVLKISFLNTTKRRLFSLLILGLVYGILVSALLYLTQGRSLTTSDMSNILAFIILSVVGSLTFFVSNVITENLFRKKLFNK